MEWQLVWGKHVQDLEKIRDRGGVVTALDTRPRVPEYLQHYWDAYEALDGTRGFSFSGMPLPVTYSEIEAYVRVHRWPQDDAVILAFFCRALDNRYLAKFVEKRTTENAGADVKGSDRRKGGHAGRSAS